VGSLSREGGGRLALRQPLSPLPSGIAPLIGSHCGLLFLNWLGFRYPFLVFFSNSLNGEMLFRFRSVPIIYIILTTGGLWAPGFL
jgi:hypothetical protein